MADIRMTGNLVADPELRYTASGTPVANFRLAHTPRRYNQQTQQWEDVGETVFLTVNAWKRLGENTAQQLHKGDRVTVTGKLTARSYETKTGEKRSVNEIQAADITVSVNNLGEKPQQSPQAAAWGQTTTQQAQQNAQQHQGHTWGQPAPTGQQEQPPF